jgi:HEAT repeat protein
MKRVLFSGMVCALAALPAAGQNVGGVPTPVAELLNRFVEERYQPGPGGEASNEISLMLFGEAQGMLGERRSQSDVDALIGGLADLVLSGPTANVRSNAAATLALAGASSARTPNPRVGLLLVKLFGQTEDAVVRMVILDSFQVLDDPSVGVDVIRRVLTEEPPSFASEGESIHAVAAAMAAGAEGRALLRQLHQAGSIKDSDARARVARESVAGRLIGGD